MRRLLASILCLAMTTAAPAETITISAEPISAFDRLAPTRSFGPFTWRGGLTLTSPAPDFGGLSEWPLDHVVKVLCFCHPDDDVAMRDAQEAVVQRLFASARRNRLEFLLEIIPSKVGPVDDQTNARLIQRFYDIGVSPDWWKLEPLQSDAAWSATVAAIEANDPHTRGIVVLGLGQTEDELAASFRLAAHYPLVRGFAVGRTIFAKAAAEWMAGRMDDRAAVQDMVENFRRLCTIWDAARGEAQ